MATGGRWTEALAGLADPFLDTPAAAALACASAGTWHVMKGSFVPRHFVTWWRAQGERLIHVLSPDEMFALHGEAWARRALTPPLPPR